MKIVREDHTGRKEILICLKAESCFVCDINTSCHSNDFLDVRKKLEKEGFIINEEEYKNMKRTKLIDKILK
jgi:hypothetical protein